MTEPSQYFKGRTVQEQMDEVISYVDVRSAEVATTAIASDVAQVHQDMLDADADASAAAASAAAAAGTLANAVKKTGESSQTVEGDLVVVGNVTGGRVTVPTPVNNTDATPKKYVDDADALKADKTYVDAQDATKISITDINSYAVGLTGNQTKTGSLALKSQLIIGDNVNPVANMLLYGRSGNRRIILENIDEDNTVLPGSTVNQSLISWCDKNDRVIVNLGVFRNTNGSTQLMAYMLKSDGTYTWRTIITSE